MKGRNPDILLVGSPLENSLRVMRATPSVPDFDKQLDKDAEGAIAASERLPFSLTPIPSSGRPGSGATGW